VPETPDSLIADAVREAASRATLPFQAARADRSFGTAFWYNDLIVAEQDGREVIRQYLVTAHARTRYAIGQWTLRPGLSEPEQPLDELVMPSFAQKWTAVGDLGAAVMPTVELHQHAEKKGWRWSTQEVTAGLAAQAEDIALLDHEPLPAYLLGHGVDENTSARHPDRPQSLVEGEVVRVAPDAPVTWSGPFPDGFDGAPVFSALPLEGGRLKLLCLGAAVAGEPVTVAPFDQLRTAIHALSPRPKRHWWSRA